MCAAGSVPVSCTTQTCPARSLSRISLGLMCVSHTQFHWIRIQSLASPFNLSRTACYWPLFDAAQGQQLPVPPRPFPPLRVVLAQLQSHPPVHLDGQGLTRTSRSAERPGADAGLSALARFKPTTAGHHPNWRTAAAAHTPEHGVRCLTCRSLLGVSEKTRISLLNTRQYH